MRCSFKIVITRFVYLRLSEKIKKCIHGFFGFITLNLKARAARRSLISLILESNTRRRKWKFPMEISRKTRCCFRESCSWIMHGALSVIRSAVVMNFTMSRKSQRKPASFFFLWTSCGHLPRIHDGMCGTRSWEKHKCLRTGFRSSFPSCRSRAFIAERKQVSNLDAPSSALEKLKTWVSTRMHFLIFSTSENQISIRSIVQKIFKLKMINFLC